MSVTRSECPDFAIDAARPSDWLELSAGFARAIPNAVVSRLGRGFGSRFYRAIGDRADCCVLVSRGGDGAIAGSVVGSLDRPRAFGDILRRHRLALALHGGVFVLRPSVLWWAAQRIWQKLARRDVRPFDGRPKAELFAIFVAPSARRLGVARQLINALEGWFAQRGLAGAYVILTETHNEPANRLYRRIGARLARQVTYCGRAVNEWHKDMPALASAEHGDSGD